MVCQAASQTRFRALKHEHGIAGRATIIVRVIACFQPLQDCQAEYFRHLLKPVTQQVIDNYKSKYYPSPGDCFGCMVKADDSWFCRQHSSRQSPSLNNMGASLQPRQQESLPACINPCACMFSANMALPGFAASGLPGLKTGQTNEAHTQFQCLPPYFQTSHPTPNPYLKEKQSAFSYKLGGKATENSMSGSLLKRFLIFDQSGNQTRLMFSSVCSPARNPIIGPTNPVCAYDWREEEPAAKMDQVYPTKPIIHEESDENHISGEGSEMHEDTEEINALLYSDDDDDYGEDDEETSTGHSPFAFNANYEKQEQVEEITEEVASSDGPTKRHRLLDGGYNKSSLMDTASSVKPYTSCKYNNDAESSCAKGRTQGEEKGSILGNKRSRKDSIRETLGILENIIPGAKGKDSLSVLEEAINYLKSLEHKAKAVGANYH